MEVIHKLMAIDPGTKATGWALFRLQRLVAAGLYRGKHAAETIGQIQAAPIYDLDVLIVERPQVYDRHRTKGDPNALIPLAMIGGAAAGVHGWAELRAPHPNEWKGAISKEIHHPRILAELRPEELAVVEAMKGVPASLRHNVLDAIGLGLWGLGRSPR